MANKMEAQRYPELVIGIAGAIGIDIEAITTTLQEALSSVGYRAVPIRITSEIASELTNVPAPSEQDFAAEASYKMAHASELCRRHQSPETLMRFAVQAIRRYRASILSDHDKKSEIDDGYLPGEERIVPRTAYLIRQLKRPEEVEFLRKIYGKQFVLISAYGSMLNRKRIIEIALRRSLPMYSTDFEISAKADELIYKDENEESNIFGQHLRDTFSLADVFIDGISKSSMVSMVSRFVDAFFGKADIAPNKDEYGMYAAKSASLRSSDLSRQVGAAIFTIDGELISQGCNEVPKAFGGTYWDGEEPDYRDVKLGHDPNEILKKEIVRDLLERLKRNGMLSEKADSIGSSSNLVEALTKSQTTNDKPPEYGSLAGSAIMELTEYGRVVHAEMCAICDAARIGRPVKGGILYCTTFPCHNCTKHLLAAGLKKVVYIEPYPKSKAKELHENEIEIDKYSETRVSFMPFLGISPLRYRDIFEKGKRKRDGKALQWIGGEPTPVINVPPPTYVDLESYELSKFLGEIRGSQITVGSEIFSDTAPIAQ